MELKIWTLSSSVSPVVHLPGDEGMFVETLVEKPLLTPALPL
jgi:hypothetical protein